MRFVTFNASVIGGEARYRVGAMLDGGEIADLTPSILPMGLSASEILRCFDLDRDFVTPATDAVHSGELPTFDRAEVTIGPPVPRPGKIICIGLNYRDHAEESGMPIPTSPIIFSKFSTSVIGAGDAIRVPASSEQVDYEAELAFVVGRTAKNVKAADAMKYVFGYTNFNDVSARDLQFADGQWQRGKSCDTFSPMGEFVATPDEIGDPHDLKIQFRLNGETLQDSRTEQLIFKIPELIEFLSASITLEPGDVVATGTPPGVGFARKPPVFLKAGDIAEIEIEGLGVLSNPVK